MAKITYGDKTGIVPKGAHKNQFWAEDANEIKNIVNGIDDVNISQQAEIDLNSNKTSNVTHTGDVTGALALTIANTVIGLNHLTATGTPDNTKFLRGDNQWAIPSIANNALLPATQTFTGVNTFTQNVGAASISINGGEVITWNDEFKTLNIPSGTGATLQVGQELYFLIYNDTGVTITNGQILVPKAAVLVGSEVIPTVILARADTHETCTGTLFVATHDILNGETGMTTTYGRVGGVDTSSFAAGDDIFLSPTVAGGIQKELPEFPNYAIDLGGVIKVDAVNGEIGINVTRDVSDTLLSAWEGSFREDLDFIVSSNGSVITGTLERTGGGDLTMILSQGLETFDCTPPATITLTAGTDTVPQRNFVYIPNTTKVLTVSTSAWPLDEHIKVANIYLQSATEVQTNGALINRNWNDHIKAAGDNGHMLHITERLRQNNASWDSGAAGTCSVSQLSNSDVYISTTSGTVYQIHAQTFPAIDMGTGGVAYIVNNFIAPFKPTSNLNTEFSDANGNVLSNSSFSFVLWGVANKTGQDSHLMINLPIGSYAKNSPNSAVSDALNYSVYTIPKEFRGTGFLIARFTYTLASNATDWVLYDTEDLRGSTPNATSGGGGGGAGVTDFTALADTPSSYVGEGTKVLRVAEGETAVEFIADNLEINAQTGTTYTLLDSDYNKLVTLDNASAVTLTVSNALSLPIGAQISIMQKGAGQVTVAASGATVNTTDTLILRTQWSMATIIQIDTDIWVLSGDVEPI